MFKKKTIRCFLRNWLGPGLALIGIGMILSILIPFWLWVLVAGIGLVCYGLSSYLK